VARKTRRSNGSGCVIKRGKGFTIRWRETLVLPDGTKRTVYRCEALGAVSKKKANSILSERMTVSQTQSRTVMTFKDLGAVWKSTALPFYKYSSRQVRETTLNKLLSRFGEMDLESVTRQEIQTYMAELSRKEYAPHSIHHVHSVLSAILGKAVKWGHLRENPANGVDLPKLMPKRPKWVLTPEQAQRLLETLAPKPRALVGLSLLTGMRRRLGSRHGAAQLLRRTAAACATGEVIRPAKNLQGLTGPSPVKSLNLTLKLNSF